MVHHSAMMVRWITIGMALHFERLLMSDLGQAVVRTWKRDGTRDVMSLDAAVENLSRNERDVTGSTDERRDSVRRALLAGEILETPLANFAMKEKPNA